MKKGLVICVVVIIILLGIGICFLIKDFSKDAETTVPSQNENALISYAKSCENMNYPGARAFTHGGDPPCDHVYSSAFFNDNSEICSYLNLDRDKAICFGVSVASIEDISLCNSLNKKNFCILNSAKKINRYSITDSVQESLEICNLIDNSSLKSICYGFVSYRFKEKSVCESLLEEKTICLNHYIESVLQDEGVRLNVNEVVKKCNEAFVEDKNLLECYYNFFPGSIDVFVNATSYSNPGTILGYPSEKILYFYDLENLTSKKVIFLTAKTEFVAPSSEKDTLEAPEGFSWGTIGSENISYLKWERYLCDSIFEDESLVNEKCEEVFGLNLGVPNLGASLKWGYYSSYIY